MFEAGTVTCVAYCTSDVVIAGSGVVVAGGGVEWPCGRVKHPEKVKVLVGVFT